MSHDIVKLLRDVPRGIGGHYHHLMQKAADEIERLREELTASHESHGNEVGALTERLSLAIHERDEARRDRCMARAVIRWDIEHPNSPQRSQTTIILLAWQIADEEGWDCFKEASNEQ